MTNNRLIVLTNKPVQISLICGLFILAACLYPHKTPELDFAQQIQLQGQLRVATQVSDSMPLSSSRAGFELALAELFAQHLGVSLQWTPSKKIYQTLGQHQADIGFIHYETALPAEPGFAATEPYLKQHLLPITAQGIADEEFSNIKLAWLYKGPHAEAFNNSVQNFFAQIRNDGTFARLYDQYFNHMDMSLAETTSFRYYANRRLPVYQTAFEKMGQKNHLDWRLLAAIGYQESHWNPDAISPTGVRGLMMLTQATANEMGVDNRHSAKQSIVGGSTYFRKIRDQLDASIPEPHRTWMALAAYNMGMGHLEDARTLTRRMKGNPDNWFDVKKSIPLLQQPRYYSQLSNGYASGAKQSLEYVRNVRRYFDMLIGYEPTPAVHATLLAMR